MQRKWLWLAAAAAVMAGAQDPQRPPGPVVAPANLKPGSGISGPGATPNDSRARWVALNRGATGSVVKLGLIPDIKPLMDIQMRDTVIRVGGDGMYYLTGSTGEDIWDHNDDVELWRSADLKKWDYLGLVWSIEKDGTWERPWRWYRKPVRALLEPDTNPAHHADTCGSRRQCSDIGHEGACLFKRNGKYYLTAADTYEGRYSSMAALSDHIYGPYKWRHEAVPSGGGTDYFQDKQGNWWDCFFGNDNQAPFREKPAMVAIEFDKDGKIHPVRR
jgi:hypothetical protein